MLETAFKGKKRCPYFRGFLRTGVPLYIYVSSPSLSLSCLRLHTALIPIVLLCPHIMDKQNYFADLTYCYLRTDISPCSSLDVEAKLTLYQVMFENKVCGERGTIYQVYYLFLSIFFSSPSKHFEGFLKMWAGVFVPPDPNTVEATPKSLPLLLPPSLPHRGAHQGQRERAR